MRLVETGETQPLQLCRDHLKITSENCGICQLIPLFQATWKSKEILSSHEYLDVFKIAAIPDKPRLR